MFVTRFAPSPTGPLHLGHAFSALTAWDAAQAAGGKLLIRMEDLDTSRCRPHFETAILEDLTWLGLTWPDPVLHQSTRTRAYTTALDRLAALGLLYPCGCTRGDIRAALSAPQEGAETLVYPGTCRARPLASRRPTDALRLNLAAALALAGPLAWREEGQGAGLHPVGIDLAQTLGDIALSRKDLGASYHLAVVVDDAAQHVTHVIRGEDLSPAAPLHRLLQALLDLPAPVWRHHRLIRDETGRRLAKRCDARALATLRAAGVTPRDVRRMVGLDREPEVNFS